MKMKQALLKAKALSMLKHIDKYFDHVDFSVWEGKGRFTATGVSGQITDMIEFKYSEIFTDGKGVAKKILSIMLGVNKDAPATYDEIKKFAKELGIS